MKVLLCRRLPAFVTVPRPPEIELPVYALPAVPCQPDADAPVFVSYAAPRVPEA